MTLQNHMQALIGRCLEQQAADAKRAALTELSARCVDIVVGSGYDGVPVAVSRCRAT